MRVRRNYLVNKRQVAAASNASAKPNSSPHCTHLTSWRKPKSPMKSNRRMSGIQDKIVAEQALEKPDPAKLKEYTSQLSQAQQFMTDLYHPEKNPGALQHLGGFIKQHLLRRPIRPRRWLHASWRWGNYAQLQRPVHYRYCSRISRGDCR